MDFNPKTLILWGAGATAELGMRTTQQQAHFLASLASKKNDLEWRISKAIKNPDSSFKRALSDLLNILGDEHKPDNNFRISSEQIETMRKNWTANNDEALKSRILYLRRQYDWPTLKNVIRICPGWRNDPDKADINLSDLFNILDMHDQSGHGFSTDGKFLSPTNIKGARNALKLLVLTMFYIDWQDLLNDNDKKHWLKQHYDFAQVFGRRMQQQGIQRIGLQNPESPNFYLDNNVFVSLNYDPIALWLQYVANRNLNKSPSVPHIGKRYPARRLQIYHDLGHVAPSRRINRENPNFARFSMNEATAQRLNDPDHKAEDFIYISKFLFPHGCLVWRECPSCGKLSSFLGDQWEEDSPTLFRDMPKSSA